MMTEKQYGGVEIICSPQLPVKIFNMKTKEYEVFHMLQKENTIFVSEDIFRSLKEIGE